MTPRRMLQWIVAFILVASFIEATPAEARTRRKTKKRPAPAQQAWLESRSAIVLDARTGRALFERQPDVQMYPASTTKVLTAIVAIEKGDLDDMVTIQPSDIKVQPSSIGLKVGERISLGDLVYGLLLRSGNDAAMAIARHVGDGDRSRFYDMMNERARKVGCTSSHFSNPHGLPDATHYTTARDLGRIMVYAMKNDTFRTVTSSTRYVSTSSQRTRVMVNKNRLLRLYPGTTGGKPGYTRAAQQTLVASAKRADRELVVVCLHSVGRALWSDAAHLFDFGFNRLGLASNGRASQPTALASLSAP